MSIITEKKCTKCELVKSLDDFYKRTSGKFGRTSQCKSCTCTTRKGRYLESVGGELKYKSDDSPNGYKKCTKCDEVKSLDEFHKTKQGKFGRTHICKTCANTNGRCIYLESVGGEYTKKSNNIISDHGDWLEVDISTPNYPNSVMKIDKVDYEMIKSNPSYGRLHVVKGNRANMYVHLNSSEGDNGKRFMVHRLLHPEWPKIDHINRNGLDNRRCNLRDGAGGVNEWNTRMYKNNTSGYTGVYQIGKKWLAKIQQGGKSMRLGVFDSSEEASSVYQNAKCERDNSTPSDKIPYDYSDPAYIHYVYLYTNILNQMIYVGKHSTRKPDPLTDGYRGSGTELNKAQKHIGMEYFEKAILHVCETRDEITAIEKELVNDEFRRRPDTYNQQVGS